MSYTLKEKTTTLWIIRATAAAALIWGVFFYLSFSVSLWFFAGVIAAAVIWVLALIFLPVLAKTFKLIVNERGITLSYGVFFKTVKICPASRLVFVQTNTTPLSKLMKLKSVSFLAAKARVTMPEIDEKDAENIALYVREVGFYE